MPLILYETFDIRWSLFELNGLRNKKKQTEDIVAKIK
jgi:hypothetical protein